MTVSEWLDQSYPDAKYGTYSNRDHKIRLLEEEMWTRIGAMLRTEVFDDATVHPTGFSILFHNGLESFDVFKDAKKVAGFTSSVRGNSFVARAYAGDWEKQISS